MNALKRAADLLQNSAEEFESHDGLSVCVGIDAWNEFFEALDSELERAQSSPVNQQMLEALKELRDAYQEFMGVQAVKANAAISAAEASGQENHQAEPVAG
ncbi:hypothetical protein LH418_15475, partial [Laribacter hongkongensis]